MRPRYQDGHIEKRGKEWFLRYYKDENGKRVRARVFLARYSDYPIRPENKHAMQELRASLQARISSILAPVNAQLTDTSNAKSNAKTRGSALGDFIEQSYFPRLEQRLQIPAGNELHIEPSTIKGYRDIWKNHVQSGPIAKIALYNFSARNGQEFLESLPQELSHQTHMRIKNFLSGVFAWAITGEAFVGVNPMDATKAGGAKKTDMAKLDSRRQKIKASNAHAYTLEEVAEMLEKLPDPARTVCAVAAFTGLTRSELRALKWSDYDGETIKVQRKYWNGYIGAPKTEAREAGIYIVPDLRKILVKYQAKFPSIGEGWMFRGEKMKQPLNLDDLSRRDIPSYINGAWFGWHAFRRGLGTRLNEAGVDANTIQNILRHADVKTTMAYYILPTAASAKAGLDKFAKTMRAIIKQR